MTICIAAASFLPYAIVTVSDMMLSDDVSSVDSAAVKTQQLTDYGSRQWSCMYSGTSSTFDNLLAEIKERVRQPGVSALQRSMQDAVEDAYSSVITRRIEREILAPFGISRDEFFRTGLERFGETYFRELSEECRKVRLDVDLIVFGFQNGVPSIFTAQKETSTCISNEQLGFQAIGAGAWAALASIYARDSWRIAPLSHVVYRACEAKFVSEMARSVGSTTVVEVFYADGGKAFIIAEETDSIRAAWEKYRDQPIPKTAMTSINKHLAQRTPAHRASRAKQLESASPNPQQTEGCEPAKPS